MLDIGWTELLVIAIVLIVVVGPKDLPPMLRAFGKMTANLRKMASEFRTQFDEALKESELDDVKQTISDAQRLNPTNALREAINPLRQMGQDIKSDLQKATQIPSTTEAAQTDFAAQQAVEGVPEPETAPEIPANFPSPSATAASSSTAATAAASGAGQPSTAAPASAQAASAAAATAPVQSAPAASPTLSEPAAMSEKSKPVRKAKAKSADDTASATAAEKPKRNRAAAKAAPAGVEAVAKVPAAKRSKKKTDTPKDDA